MPKYLYGAAVQGIQNFIYQTNKLREIVGASELVEMICTQLFAKVLYVADSGGILSPAASFEKLVADPHSIIRAAGNIKYIFTDKKRCEEVVRVFPKVVMEFAPGVTISQSVVEFEDGEFQEAVMRLEGNLRTQRNRPMRDLNIGLMGILRSRNTGLPVSHVISYNGHNEYLDSATYHKLYDLASGKRKETFLLLCEKAFGDSMDVKKLNTYERLPLDIKDMTGSNDWVAIIHADGNGLGHVVQKIGTDEKKFREFSVLLDKSTSQAAVMAFEEVILPAMSEAECVPLRPIVLGGDDLTVICRADLAIGYTESFLRHFEEKTHENLGEILLGKRDDGEAGKPIFRDKADYLTACAGIAFIKSSFPFHFGYDLAESLCSEAKKDTKNLYNASAGNLPASCLMFHKVQDSFVTDFSDIVVRELQPYEGVSFRFGPYYLTPSSNLTSTASTASLSAGRWTVDKLILHAKKLEGDEGNKVKSQLRNWLTLLYDNPGLARQKLERAVQVSNQGELIRSLTSEDSVDVRIIPADDNDGSQWVIYPVYDILSIYSINNQITR